MQTQELSVKNFAGNFECGRLVVVCSDEIQEKHVLKGNTASCDGRVFQFLITGRFGMMKFNLSRIGFGKTKIADQMITKVNKMLPILSKLQGVPHPRAVTTAERALFRCICCARGVVATRASVTAPDRIDSKVAPSMREGGLRPPNN